MITRSAFKKPFIFKLVLLCSCAVVAASESTLAAQIVAPKQIVTATTQQTFDGSLDGIPAELATITTRGRGERAV